MMSGGRERTTSRASRRITSRRRGSVSPANSCARSTPRPPEIDDSALDLGDRLLRDHEHVVVLEVPCGRDDERAEVVPPRAPGSRGSGSRAAPRSRQSRDPDARVTLVALVHVHDHGREPLEGPGARERARVERARLVSLDRRARARGPSRPRRHRTRTRPRPTDDPLRGSTPRGVQPRHDRCGELRLDPLCERKRPTGAGKTPSFEKRSSEATESTGVWPIVTRARAPCRALPRR